MTASQAAQAEEGDWLVGNPTGSQLASALWIGSVGLLILGQIGNVATVPAITALLSIFCYFMFFGAVWAFLEPIGAQFGIDGRTVGLMVSASLAAQVIGAMTATVFEARIDYRFAITIIGIVAAISSVLLAS
ncbi:hypothetical protein EN766_24615, partial [Mesorhizobium sp. M2A.F.Ca.ET.046.02.1.1]